MFTHPREAEIGEVYKSGKSLRETAMALGLGRKQVEDAVKRMGIARPGPVTGFIDWQMAAALYNAGYGTKAIAKRFGAYYPSIRQGLIKRGVYQSNRPTKRANQNSAWAGYVEAEITPQIKQERQHQGWWRQAHPSAKTPMEYYYENHAHRKAIGAKSARAQYHRNKTTPLFKAKLFARRQLKRIAQQTSGFKKQDLTANYLGCSYKEAVAHIAKQFIKGWDWNNYGKTWEIDHIVQLSDVNLLDDSELRRVCHYTNLRPLAKTANRSRPKGKFARRQYAAA